MGYTRYYEIFQKIEKSEFEKFSKDCKDVCDEVTRKFGHGISGFDGEGEAQFTSNEICFNGVGNYSCETFGIGVNSIGFNFTKTNRNPYDRHVLACLLLAKIYFGDKIKINSDGDNDDLDIESLVDEFRKSNLNPR